MWLGDHGYDVEFGARPLRRVIRREIGDPLAVALLEGRYKKKTKRSPWASRGTGSSSARPRRCKLCTV